jgi:hypothetical protein
MTGEEWPRISRTILTPEEGFPLCPTWYVPVNKATRGATIADSLWTTNLGSTIDANHLATGILASAWERIDRDVHAER